MNEKWNERESGGNETDKYVSPQLTSQIVIQTFSSRLNSGGSSTTEKANEIQNEEKRKGIGRIKRFKKMLEKEAFELYSQREKENRTIQLK